VEKLEVLSKTNGKFGKTKARRNWGWSCGFSEVYIGLLFIPVKHTGVFIMREPP